MILKYVFFSRSLTFVSQFSRSGSPEATGVINGMFVVESRRLDLSRTEGPAEPFLKTVRHGEFYPMVDENAQDEHNNYTSAWRNITVWDEQATQYVKLTLLTPSRTVVAGLRRAILTTLTTNSLVSQSRQA